MTNETWKDIGKAFVDTVVTILIVGVPCAIVAAVVTYGGVYGVFAMMFCFMWAVNYYLNKVL